MSRVANRIKEKASGQVLRWSLKSTTLCNTFTDCMNWAFRLKPSYHPPKASKQAEHDDKHKVTAHLAKCSSASGTESYLFPNHQRLSDAYNKVAYNDTRRNNQPGNDMAYAFIKECRQ